MMQTHNTVMQESFTPCDRTQVSGQSSCGLSSRKAFVGVIGQIAIARHWLAGCLPGGTSHPAADDLLLIGDELITNALHHTRSGEPGGRFTVVYDTDAHGRPVVGVYDLGGDSVPTPRPPDLEALAEPDPDAPFGYSLGLYGISQLAAEWGSERLPSGGRYTWAAVEL